MKVEIGPYPEGDEERGVSIQIDDYDVWSAYETIALVVAPLLRKLKQKKQGSPLVDLEDVPESLRGSGGEDGGIHKRWEWVLDEIIWSFENIGEDPDVDVEWAEGPEHGKEHMRGNTKTYTWDMIPEPKAWEEYQKQTAELEKRVDNGLRLFAKYMRSMWD